MANRVSNEQIFILLSFLEEHRALAKSTGANVRNKEAVEKQWNDIAHKLNSCGSGSTKTGDRWKKYWADIKHKAKNRLTKLMTDALNTGRDPHNLEDMSDIDKKILEIIGEDIIKNRSSLFSQNTQTKTFDADSVISVLVPEDILGSDSVERSGTLSPVIDVDRSTRCKSEASNSEASLPASPLQQIPVTGSQTPVSLSSGTRSQNRSRRRPRPYSKKAYDVCIELERRRVQAEMKMAEAACVVAEASRVQAEASRVQVEAFRTHAEATLVHARTAHDHAQALNTLTDIVRELFSRLPPRKESSKH